MPVDTLAPLDFEFVPQLPVFLPGGGDVSRAYSLTMA